MASNGQRRSAAATTAATLMKNIGTIVVTVFAFGIVLWWLIVVLNKIGTAPTVNSKGAVTLDQYQRAKDILLIVFPLATAAVGYWLGSRGTAKAQDQAQQAHSKLAAVLNASPDTNLLNRAAEAFPAAFPDLKPAPRAQPGGQGG